MDSKSQKLDLLEVFRGFAAIWVLLHHANLTVVDFVGNPDSAFIAKGLLGVDFFFILSGFIISFSTKKLKESKSGIKLYLTSRLLRIYLPYLPVGLTLYLLYFMLPEVSGSSRDIGFLTTLTLYPTSSDPALSVAWTLMHELVFYFLYVSFFLGRFVFASVMVCWLVSILLPLFGLNFWNSGVVVDVVTHPLNLWFFVGMLIARLPDTELDQVKSVVSIAILFLVLLVLVELDVSRVFCGAAMAITVFLVAKSDLKFMHVNKKLLLLGSSSYSVYLVHNPVQSLVIRASLFVGIDDVWLSLFIVSVASFFVGLVYYFLWERRMQALSKTMLYAVSGSSFRQAHISS